MTVLQSAYESYLKMDLSKYAGAWIAVSKDKVIAVGKDPKRTYDRALKIDKSGQFMLTKVTSKGLYGCASGSQAS
jgi:hypothetical protein